MKIDRSILEKAPAAMTDRDFTFFPVPTRGTVMHRITQGPDGKMWFTELGVDQVGTIDN